MMRIACLERRGGWKSNSKWSGHTIRRMFTPGCAMPLFRPRLRKAHSRFLMSASPGAFRTVAMTMRKRQSVWGLLMMMAVLVIGGCSHDAGVIFPLVKDAPVWPARPDAARIRYVGELRGNADLKAAVSGLTQLGNAVFGSGEQAYTFVNPMAVCTDGVSRVFVADSGDHVIHVLDLDTRKYARWTPTGRALIAPVGLAYDSAG